MNKTRFIGSGAFHINHHHSRLAKDLLVFLGYPRKISTTP